ITRNEQTALENDRKIEQAIAPPLVARSQPSNDTVFLVHGHDVSAKEATARFLEKLKLKTIILHEQPSGGRRLTRSLRFSCLSRSSGTTTFAKDSAKACCPVNGKMRSSRRTICFAAMKSSREPICDVGVWRCAGDRSGRRPDHSGLMPANLTTL